MSAPIAHLGVDDAARYTRLLDQLEAQLRALPDKPEENARSTLHTLWWLAAGQPMSATAAMENALPSLDSAADARLSALLAQRLAGTPLAHMTQRQRFMGLEMLAGPEALIPRRETELLAGAATRLLMDLCTTVPTPLIIDVCTGCANVAAALAHAAPRAKVMASDLSPDAVALAGRNLAHLGLTDRVELRVGDLLAPFDEASLWGRVDLLTCNPPYISAARRATMDDEIAGHEPALAFDGGALGIRILQRLVREAPRFLRAGGWLAFEVGAGQGRAVRQRLQSGQDFDDITEVLDAKGEVRALCARRAGPKS